MAMAKKYKRMEDCKKEAQEIAEKGTGKEKDTQRLLALIVELLSVRI